MTENASPPSRRRWREEHKPAVRHWRHGFFTAFRRDDPVFVVTSFLLKVACAGMLAAAVGGRGSGRMTSDVSAVVVAVSAGGIALALVAMAVRAHVTRANAPLSAGGAVFGICLSAVSTTLVVARAGGVLSTPIWWMFASMLACAVIASITVPTSILRSSDRRRLQPTPATSSTEADAPPAGFET